MASVLEVEDEPEEKDAFNSLHEHARLEELARRNTLCLPHLRSVYPVEEFSTADDDVGGLTKESSRSTVVESHVKDFSRSSVIGGASRESSRSSFAGGRTKALSGPSVVEGHFKDISRSSIVDDQVKESLRSRPSSAASLPTHSDLSSQENIKRKVNISIIIISIIVISVIIISIIVISVIIISIISIIIISSSSIMNAQCYCWQEAYSL